MSAVKDPYSYLDMEVIKELKQLMGEDFPLLIQTFERDSLDRIKLIRRAQASGQAEQLRRAAHGLKGSAGNIGASLLAELSSRLEQRGQSGIGDDCPELIDQLAEAFQHTIEVLNSLL